MFLAYCSSLFPRHSKELLTSLELNKLAKLDNTIRQTPWVLGYRELMTKMFGVRNCEVKLKGFHDSGLFDTFDQKMQDPLYVYNAMTRITFEEGHTYVTLRQLQNVRYYSERFAVVARKVSEEAFTCALEYLTEERILEKHKLSGGLDIVMFPHIKQYEDSIAYNIANIMKGESCVPSSAINKEVSECVRILRSS